MDLTPTPSQTVGPYLHLGLTDRRSVACVAGDAAKGERVWLTFRVLDGEGVPVPDAMIELWQADSEGNYPSALRVVHAFCGFGRLATREDGSCTFETIRPGRVLGSRTEHYQAPHINVSILGRGILKRLSTRRVLRRRAGERCRSDPGVGAGESACHFAGASGSRLAPVVGTLKFACVERARRCFSMCNLLQQDRFAKIRERILRSQR